MDPTHPSLSAQQSKLALEREGLETWIIETIYGRILVEYCNGVTLVNGSPVEPYAETLKQMRLKKETSCE